MVSEGKWVLAQELAHHNHIFSIHHKHNILAGKGIGSRLARRILASAVYWQGRSVST